MFALVLQPIYGALSDRIGRKPLLIWFGVSGTLFTVPLLYCAAERRRARCVAFLLIAAAWLIVAGYTSINAVVKAELFPTRVRATGVGLPYAVTVSIFGGTAESIALWFKSIGHETWFYYYLTAVIATSLLVYATMRDTRDALGHRTPRVALFHPRERFGRDAFGRLGFPGRGHRRSEAPFRLHAPRRAAADVGRTQVLVRPPQRLGARPPACAAQPQELAHGADERLVLGRHVLKRLDAGIRRLELGDDGTVGEIRERIRAEALMREPVERLVVGAGGLRFGGDDGVDGRLDVGDVAQRKQRRRPPRLLRRRRWRRLLAVFGARLAARQPSTAPNARPTKNEASSLAVATPSTALTSRNRTPTTAMRFIAITGITIGGGATSSSAALSRGRRASCHRMHAAITPYDGPDGRRCAGPHVDRLRRHVVQAGEDAARDIRRGQRGSPDETLDDGAELQEHDRVDRELNDANVHEQRSQQPPPFAVRRSRPQIRAPADERGRIGQRARSPNHQHEHRDVEREESRHHDETRRAGAKRGEKRLVVRPRRGGGAFQLLRIRGRHREVAGPILGLDDAIGDDAEHGKEDQKVHAAGSSRRVPADDAVRAGISRDRAGAEGAD